MDTLTKQNRANELIQRCAVAKEQPLAVRTRVIIEGVLFLAECEVCRLTAQMRALTITTRDQLGRKNCDG